jgi:hypothetical protein
VLDNAAQMFDVANLLQKLLERRTSISFHFHLNEFHHRIGRSTTLRTNAIEKEKYTVSAVLYNRNEFNNFTATSRKRIRRGEIVGGCTDLQTIQCVDADESQMEREREIERSENTTEKITKRLYTRENSEKKGKEKKEKTTTSLIIHIVHDQCTEASSLASCIPAVSQTATYTRPLQSFRKTLRLCENKIVNVTWFPI